MTKPPFPSFLATLLATLLPTTAFAATAPATYTLMAPLGGVLTGSPNLTTYLQGIVQVTIGIAGVLAVIMIVVCGIKLMGTPSASGKSEAKECVWNAIFGVLLALGAWILLNTINPLLLSNEVNLTEVVSAPATPPPSGPVTDPYPTKAGWYFKYSDATGIHYNPGGASAETCAALIAPAIATGKTIIDVNGQKCFQVLAPNVSTSQGELATRNALCGNNSCVGSTPIGINNRPCAYVGAKGCTNVDGLPSVAVDVIRSIQQACSRNVSCNVVITGGTEYWLHKTHAANKPIFDLRKSTAVNSFLLTNGTGKRASFTNYRVYWNGFWWTDEGDHWHTCQAGVGLSWYCDNWTTSGRTIQKDPSIALMN